MCDLLRVYFEVIRKDDKQGSRWASTRSRRQRNNSCGDGRLGRPATGEAERPPKSQQAARRHCLPGRLAILEAQRHGVAAFDNLARQRQVHAVLLHLGPRDLNLVVRLERHAHVVEKFLRTKKNLD